ncbi:retrotransposon hot spot (RHS) protein [Trypanosoma cruzi]|nr:retrotransposon hot spot (RHS) protein [Trypanosoma cruzi]
MGESSIAKVVKDLSRRGVRGCIVYDAAEPDNLLSTCLPPLEWGMLVVTPPETKIYGHWASGRRAARIVMDCPDESDAEAMCAWMKRDQPVQQQAECWGEVRGQMDAAGPLLRDIFGKRHCTARIEKCHSVGAGTNSSRSRCYFGFGISKTWDDNTALECVAKIVRVRGERNGESPFNAPISAHLGSKILCSLAKLMRPNDLILIVWRLKDYLISENFGKCSVFAFLNGVFLAAIRRKLKELRPPTRRLPHRCALEVYSQERPTRHYFLPPLEHVSERIDVERGVLYITEVEGFPLEDAFSS